MMSTTDVCKTTSQTNSEILPVTKRDAKNAVPEINFFLQIISPELINQIAYCTNLYISHKCEAVEYSCEHEAKLMSIK